MKKIIPEFEFTPQEEEGILGCARELNLSETTAKILYARGMDSVEKMRTFMNPSSRNFLSPYLMSGIKEAKELITRARDEEWRVAVFGDYDADGIGALAILYRALKEFGIEAYLHVPERTDGYGLSVSSIDKIFDEFLPDLIITVDCGISCADEVEYIKEQGAFVIVTDHHELPARLPDCIVVNPKIQDDYPYDNLAGAGVAFKLATALIGEKANTLLDFCALSTVADSVPLLGENRDIVAEGIKLIERSPRPAFSAFLNREKVDAQTLAFTIAPRLNAAGRMGDALSALKMFVSEDEEEIYALAAKLNEYNAERQKYCDGLHEEVTRRVRETGAHEHVVVACGEHWNAGIVGIVAARVAEEYCRPCLLFVKNGNMYRGSARSIEGVNIFEALTACSEYIEEFGGHAQAAGVNVREENLAPLSDALESYLAAHCDDEDFVSKICVTGEMTDDPLTLAKELELLEPFGVGNRRPVFVRRAEKMTAAPMKAESPHLLVSDGAMDYTYFFGAAQRTLLESAIQKEVVFELNLSKFRGKERAKGNIRAVIYDAKEASEADGEIFENNLLSCARHSVGANSAEELSEKQLRELVEKLSSENGVCYIAYERETAERLAPSGLVAELFRPMAGNARQTLIVSPAEDMDFSVYSTLVFLDKPLFFPPITKAQRAYCNRDAEGYRALKKLSADRGVLTEIFVRARGDAFQLRGETPLQAAKSCLALGFDERQFMFALAVFEELGIVKLTESGMMVQKGVKRELTDSAIYGAVLGLTES